MPDEYHDEGEYVAEIDGAQLFRREHHDVDKTFVSVECRSGVLSFTLQCRIWESWYLYSAWKPATPNHVKFSDDRRDLEKQGYVDFHPWYLSAGQSLRMGGRVPSSMWDGDVLLDVLARAANTKCYIIFESIDD